MGPTAIAATWFDMCRTGDASRLDDLVTDDYVGHGPGGAGDRTTLADWLEWYATAFAEQRAAVEDVIASGDRVVVRYTVRSTYRGGYLDLPARDQEVQETGIIIFRLAGERIAETWLEGNDLEVARQLGGRVAPTRHMI
jgi:steroid delta-isomerase-like uncharacterized protein